MDRKILLLDIEGTTTPISFVYDTLFPYAYERVERFLLDHFDAADVAADRIALADEEGINPDSLQDLVAAVRRQMDNDQKTTALKSLQGKIWLDGYEDGSLLGEVFDDVPRVMAEIKETGARVCIYSSGSVAAQKLLFRHSTAGDLTPMIDAYFDTTTGPKKVAKSYHAIAAALGAQPDEIVFCTDNLLEAKSAAHAGVHAVMLDRPGNPDPGEHDFETWPTLEPALELF